MNKFLLLNSKFKTNKANVSTKQIFGADHIIIEGVGSMICNTVMNGILYTDESIKNLAKNTPGNVHSPSSHPINDNGDFILAGDPQAVHQNYVGAMSFNYRMKGDRLIHDLAINPEIAARSEDGVEILSRIENNQDIDTSTGIIIHAFEEAEGFGQCGTKYTRIANELQLDHDAILLNERGAATTLQGVGVFANSDNKKVSIDEFTVNASIANNELELVDIEYDKDAAIQRIKDFTNSSESPSSNYRRFFLDFDRDNTESFDGYKYPFADVVDGQPVAVKKALIDAKKDIESDGPENKSELINFVDAMIEKTDVKGNMFGNAWKAIKGLFFGNELSHGNVQESLYNLINEDNEDDYSAYPTEIFDNYFIFRKSDGKMFKSMYNVINDVVKLEGIPFEVTQETIYKPKEETFIMKDKILNALKSAGINTEGMDDDKLFNEFSKLKAEKAKNAEDETADDKKEVKANAADLDIAKIIANAVAKAIAPIEAKLEANADKEIDALADQVVELDLGINKETAKIMGINSMKDILAKNGIVAFNAEAPAKTKLKANSVRSELPK